MRMMGGREHDRQGGVCKYEVDSKIKKLNMVRASEGGNAEQGGGGMQKSFRSNPVL